MTVGEVLTGARNQAGLSVEELSERTQIRGTVIRSIEQDDYAACGGDLYVRGYVRALAGAVGLDAQPLINEYDLARVDQPYERASGSTGRHAQGLPRAFPDSDADSDADTTRFDLPPVSEDPAATRYDLPPVPAAAADPDATRYDLPPVTDAATTIYPAIGSSPASPFPPPPGQYVPPPGQYAPPPGQYAPPPGHYVPPPGQYVPPLYGNPVRPAALSGRRKRRTLIAAAVLVVLAAGGGLGVALTSGGGTTAISPAANSKSTAAAPASPIAPGASATASGAGNEAATGATVTTLPVASVKAFGPDGTADGDNAGDAKNAISGSETSPWSTQWYATAKFGQLKSGTGLLLDLGGTVTVTSVRLELSQNRGATVQLHVGRTTSDLKMAVAKSDAGGTVQLTLKHPATGKYLLVWLTKLPPDGAGHYAETVSHLKVQGYR